MSRRIAVFLAVMMALAGAVIGSTVAVAPAAALPPECRPYPANCPDPLPPLTSIDRGQTVTDLGNGCKRETLMGSLQLDNPTELLFVLAVTVDYCLRVDRVEVVALNNSVVEEGRPNGAILSINGTARNMIRSNFTASVVIDSGRAFSICKPQCLRARYKLFGLVKLTGVQAEFGIEQLP